MGLHLPEQPTLEKAAWWMLRYLGHAEAKKILEIASAEIENKAKNANKDTEMIDAKGEGWTCEIKKNPKKQKVIKKLKM